MVSQITSFVLSFGLTVAPSDHTFYSLKHIFAPLPLPPSRMAKDNSYCAPQASQKVKDDLGISVLLAFAMLGSTPQEGNAGNYKGFPGILNHPWPCVYIQRQGTV